ncbi:MAG: apolipoprotein N-acyltransferase [Acidobacteria bacterium]|nr:apolipoprotein N-acyltransferase [Acidobacteriota bacterium]
MLTNIILAAATGLLLVLLHPPFGLWFLAPAALAPLLIACAREPRWQRRLLLGLASGYVHWFGLCPWIQFVLEVHGDMGYWGSRGTFLLFCLLKALHFALFAALAGWAMRLPWAALAAPALWVGIERTNGPFGFAWLTLGNAGTDMGLPMRLAPITGVYGLSFVFALMAAVLALALLRRPRLHLAPIALVPLLMLLPALPEPVTPDRHVAAVQSNFEESHYYSRDEMAREISELALLTTSQVLQPGQPKPDLLLWPEVPAPLFYSTDGATRTATESIARTTKTPFLFGAVTYTLEGAPLNSAVLLGEKGQSLSRYDKMYLVPFGEFVPPVFSFVNRISDGVGDYAPGQNLVVTRLNGHRIGTFICYESAFPHFVREFPNAGADILINLTNDGYFGRSAARQQHLQLARMRAAENRRWILRPTNDGITASIDPAGRVIQQFPEFVRTSGRLGFRYETTKTLYTKHGDWFAWGCLILALAAVVYAMYRPNYSRPSAP